jgi:hypothetical protein
MRVINKTHWRTDQLKAIIHRAAIDELSPAKRKQVECTIVYTKRTSIGSSGCAVLGGTQMVLRIGRDTLDRIDLAHVAAHECAHLRGMTHGQMRNNPRYRRIPGRTASIYAWAEGLPVEKTQPKASKSAFEQFEIKLAHAQSAAKKHSAKLKRNQNLLQKWQRKIRYYEKKLLTLNATKDAFVHSEKATQQEPTQISA